MDVERARETIAAKPPRRLRLDELLRELGAHVGDDPPETRRPTIRLGELVDVGAEAGFGFLMAVLGLIAIPFVGLSTPFGVALALLGMQLLFGRDQPWLPARLRRRELAMTMLDRILGMLTRRLRWLAASTKRRRERWIMPRLVGFAITLLALALALPLPIPGSNLVFIVPILIYSIGLLERDGAWIAVGHAATLVDLALLVAFGATVVAVLERVVRWLF